MKNKNEHPNIGKVRRIALGSILAGMILAGVMIGISVMKYRPVQENPEEIASTDAEETLGIKELLDTVIGIKDDAYVIIHNIKSGDLAAAELNVQAVSRKVAAVHVTVDTVAEKLGKTMPFLKTQLEDVQQLLDLADIALGKIAQPTIRQLQTYPISNLKAREGINAKLVCEYLDFLESIIPDVEMLIQGANSVDFSIIDKEGKLSGYLQTANGLLAFYREEDMLIPKMKAILGEDGDRTYLLAAQNSAEIRASGGFPGAMGVIRIQDGILLLEEFESVYKVLSADTPPVANVTGRENQLFHSGLLAPRDADYCPDFERVAYIWSLGYKARNGEEIDGVISVTPVVVQKLLAAMDAEIELFDGTILNGENAVKVLQHDLYFQYLGRNSVSGGEKITDQLFADAAKKMMEKLISNFTVSNITKYVSVAKECIDQRILMLWMKDEAEQALIQWLGWNGGLNIDPQDPQAGIYFNCSIASKMGWYLVMDVQVGDRFKNENDSYIYPMTVTLSNTMTQEELSAASRYIAGSGWGVIGGSVYFFAPAGGTVSNFTISDNNLVLSESAYHDLQLGYIHSLNIRQGQSVTVTYYVTTAPGVETPLTLSMTPTLQDYH